MAGRWEGRAVWATPEPAARCPGEKDRLLLGALALQDSLQGWGPVSTSPLLGPLLLLSQLTSEQESGVYRKEAAGRCRLSLQAPLFTAGATAGQTCPRNQPTWGQRKPQALPWAQRKEKRFIPQWGWLLLGGGAKSTRQHPAFRPPKTRGCPPYHSPQLSNGGPQPPSSRAAAATEVETASLAKSVAISCMR